MQLTSEDFQSMDSRYRATLANSLSGFKPANLIGTCNTAGQTNLAIMSSVLHLGSHPPLLALVIRPDSAERHTLRNILEMGCFTINHVSEAIIDAAHQTAARYPQDVSEFDATGLDTLWDDEFAAPFVAQSPVRLGLKLREHQHLKINDTNLVIGEIVLACLPGEAVSTSGSLDINAVGSIAISGLDTYHRGHRVKRMAYAKPDQSPQLVRD
ncbi:MAG: flavin reductase (DIM6/NTAB) family NADH-FMN oxidoreductase RutF [Halieaceae bacterium]|jgi:flavin reductase (DIM6/NTAB) family NADH-FMN oxidoreductase RutF